jgi:hypothetical protein
MDLPKQPGCSFDYIWGLVDKNKSMLGAAGIGPEMVIAIFWEETLFNNIFQTTPGTAVGFGQTEPGEFYRFNADNINSRDKQIANIARTAQSKGYAVAGLPRVIRPPGKSPYSSGPLTDVQSVQVALAVIRDLSERKMSADGILKGYAGVGFKGEQGARLARPGGREAIIQGWRSCENQLQKAVPAKDRAGILQALKEARAFNQDDAFGKILFPN